MYGLDLSRRVLLLERKETSGKRPFQSWGSERRNPGILPPMPNLESPDKRDYWLILCSLPTPGVNANCLLREKPANDRPCQTLLGSWRSQEHCLSWQRWGSRNTPICQGFCRPSPAWGSGKVHDLGRGLHSYHHLSDTCSLCGDSALLTEQLDCVNVIGKNKSNSILDLFLLL